MAADHRSLLQKTVQTVGKARVMEAIRTTLTTAQAAFILFTWIALARPSQLAPVGLWRVWLIMTGRGWGKTRCGAEWVRGRVEAGHARHIALVGQTPGDVRDVMVEGQSGILSLYPDGDWRKPKYEPSKRRLTWFAEDGVTIRAVATVYSSEGVKTAGQTDVRHLRGPQHDTAWVDELAAFRFPSAVWTQLMYGLRLSAGGDMPRVCVTTTPKPIAVLKRLVARVEKGNTRIRITGGSMYENAANLHADFIQEIEEEHEDTRLGPQEIYGLLLREVQGALWNYDRLQVNRVQLYIPGPGNAVPGFETSKVAWYTFPGGHIGPLPDMDRIVVAVDPAGGVGVTGIIVIGLGVDSHGYVLADMSAAMSAAGWGQRAVDAYHEWKADAIVGEINNGGDMVENTIRTVEDGENVNYWEVRASRGKAKRAEPVAALDERGKLHHVGTFGDLEAQLVAMKAAPDGYQGEGSPDRLDALVWGATKLMLGKKKKKAKPLDMRRGMTQGMRRDSLGIDEYHGRRNR